MNNQIYVKSVAGNRVRLKSDIFLNRNNILKIEDELGDVLTSFRANISCKSIVFKHELDVSLESIISKIKELFQIKNIELSKITADTLCGSNSCSTCNIKEHNPTSFKKKLFEFALLSGYAVYVFASDLLFGVTVATSPFSLLAVVSVVAAYPLLKDSYEDIKQGNFTLETFMGGTLLTAIFFGEVTAAFEIIYILRGGLLLEEFIATKSRDEIHKLVELGIKKAYVVSDDNLEIEVDIDDIREDDIVVVRSGDKIPVDGFIDDGTCEINESIINGRSEPEFKQIGDAVYAGTLCEKGRIYIKVGAVGNETYISRTMKKVENALANKSPSEVEADVLAQKLLKLGTFLTIGTFVVTGSFSAAFATMIVMSCPCATVLAASTAISAGIANGAKQGILIKGGEALENVSKADVFCFDKTGTLTTGKPLLTNIKLADGILEEDMIFYAAVAEYRNTHPIAKSIIEYARSKGTDFDLVALSEIVPGYGVRAKIHIDTILVGNKKFLEQNDIDASIFDEDAKSWLESGQTVVYVVKNDTLLGIMGFTHEVRPKTKEMIAHLREQGVKHIVLLTGDETRVANGFALDFGFDRVYADQTPEGKANAIEELKEEFGKVVMIGDGVNDTFAMSKADVSVSFAAGGSEAAIAVSDIAITHSHPEDVVNLYEVSKKSINVVNQNYYIGTGTNLIGVGLSAIGMLSPVGAGLIHIGHTVGIMANSSKLVLEDK